MSELEKDRLNTGAPDYSKKIEQMEKEIREEVEKDLPNLSPEGREAIIRSRLGILNPSTRPTLVKVDLGGNASKKSKDGLFE